MLSPAWIEPGTASLCLYCSALLLRGRAGARVLSRRLKRSGETLADVALDEFSDFLCDHPDVLLTVLVLSASALPGPDGAPRCRLVARAPALTRTLTRSTRTLTRAVAKSGRDQLLHLLQRPDPPPQHVGLQQAQAEPDQPGGVRLRPVPANALRLPVLLRRAGRGKGPALHLLCQLAAAVVGRWAKKGGKKAVAPRGSGRALHAAAGDGPVP